MSSNQQEMVYPRAMAQAWIEARWRSPSCWLVETLTYAAIRGDASVGCLLMLFSLVGFSKIENRWS